MRRYCRVVLPAMAIVALVACSESDAPPVAVGELSRDNTFVGCVAQTGQPDVFLLSIVEPRKTQEGGAPGTVVPQSTQGPAESSPRETGLNPVSTIGPGAGPTTTTEIQTYRMIGSGGVDLRSAVGRMIEVEGEVEEVPEDRPRGGAASPIGELRVTSARRLADECPR